MPLTTAKSPHSVQATVQRITAALADRGATVFCQVDHAAAARAVGLELADEVVVIFGDPRVGTLLMQTDPAVGYELPLRVLVWDAQDQTIVGYRRPTELRGEFMLDDQVAVLERMDQLLQQLVAAGIAAA